MLAWQLAPHDPAPPTRTSSRPPTTSSPTGRAPRRSAGRTRAATHPRRSPRRSPVSCARPTSRSANGDDASAKQYLRDRRRVAAQGRSPGPSPATARSSLAVLPAPDQGRQPNTGTTYNDRRQRAGRRRPAARRRPELPGTRPPRRQAAPTTRPILNTIKVVDQQLGVHDAERRVLAPVQLRRVRREAPTAAPWNIGFNPRAPDDSARIWPIFAGERGEYELAAGQPRNAQLAAMAADRQRRLPARRAGLGQQPAGRAPRLRAGRAGTLSATPLAWSHAQYIRLAWSIPPARLSSSRRSSPAATRALTASCLLANVLTSKHSKRRGHDDQRDREFPIDGQPDVR